MNLLRETRAFADNLSDLLNGTICHGIRMSAMQSSTNRNQVWVSFRANLHRLVGTPGIPVSVGRAPRCWLDVSFVLSIDEFNQHLMVVTSYIGLYANVGLTQVLLHYDYERDKRDGYPDAHLQIPATSDPWASLLARCPGDSNELGRLHLPTGGRRFRPTVEDVIEFLIVERIAEARDGWRDVVSRSRDLFLGRQLRAAVRRYPETAAHQLTSMGYAVAAP